jgi:hypothetical protein
VDPDQPPHDSGTRTASSGEEVTSPSSPSSESEQPGAKPPGTSAPDIMSKLPKTRPQRSSDRRRAAARRTAPRGSTTTRRATARKATTTPKRAPAPRPRTTTGAARVTTRKPAAQAQQATSVERAPSLPRLAFDGATEAVKLPLKVSGRLTLRALDAVARGLRGS